MKDFRRHEYLVLGLILGIAAALRLWRLELMQFHYDDGISLIYGMQILDGQWKLVGLKSSFGFYNPPLFVYLLSLPMLISKNPQFIAGLVALLNTAAVCAVYLAARRSFGLNAAWVASLMMACSPAAIFASRRIYAQDCVPLLACLIFLFAVRMFHEGKKRDIFLTVFLTGCLVQIHYSGILLLAALGLAWLTIRTRLSRKWVIVGLLAAAIPFIPFMVHLVQSGFEDIRGIVLTAAGTGGDVGRNRLDVFRFAYNLVSDADVDWILGPVFQHAELMLPGRMILKHMVNILVVISLLLLIPKWRMDRNEGAGSIGLNPDRQDVVVKLILCWTGVPIMIYFATGIRMFPSYLFILYPVPFLLAGRLAERFMNPVGTGRFYGVPIVILIAAWCLYHAGFYTASLQIQDRAIKEQAPYVPLRDQVAAASMIADRLVPGGTQVLQNFWEPGTGIHYNYTYLITWQHDPDRRGSLYSSDHPAPWVRFRIIDYPFLREHEHEARSWQLVRGMQFRDYGALRVYYESRPE